uniref:Uncharacterized protein n=1 Tax=Anguilla anguilla TaxID=7936 RepID=A0A0E9RDY7_ANGAN
MILINSADIFSLISI